MINLLPPETKEQIHFSKVNVVLRRFAVLAAVISLALVGTLWATHTYADQQIADLEEEIEERHQELGEYQELEQRITNFDNRLNAIDRLYDQQTRFSALLEDIAAVLPRGAYINSINLTGDSDQPIQITISTQSFDQAGTIGGALSSSERIESVDIQNISDDNGRYSVTVVLAFSEGGAR